MISLMWDIKLKLIDTDNSMVVTRVKGLREWWGSKGDQIYGDGRWFDFGRRAHNAIRRSCIIEMYT